MNLRVRVIRLTSSSVKASLLIALCRGDCKFDIEFFSQDVSFFFFFSKVWFSVLINNFHLRFICLGKCRKLSRLW